MANDSGIKGYVETSVKKSLAERREYSLFNHITVYIKEPLTEDINLTMVIAKVEKLIPRQLTSEVDTIIIGQFDFLLDREVTALFKDGAIYISNEQRTEEGLLEDLIHEISHAVETAHGQEIYGDSRNVSYGKSTRYEQICSQV